MDPAAAYLKVFVAIYVLVNPLEGIPIFLARTQGMPDAARGTVARTAAFGVTIILLVSLAIGRGLLALLNISIGAFTVAGGIIIFLIALKMVLGASGDSKLAGGDASQERFAIVPLAIPLLAGPGAISGVIVYASKGPVGDGCTLGDYGILAAIIIVVGVATWLALRAAEPMRRLLGATGIDVSTRVSGILVAAIAVGLVQEGVVRLFPALVR
jgi:multiple antibiotic resistance protein